MSYKQVSSKSFFRRLATAPFRLLLAGWLLLESIFFGLLFRLIRTVFRLLASPWGLILPITGIVALIFASMLDKVPRQIALDLVEAAAKADAADIPGIMRELEDLDDNAVPAYIRGIALSRDEVFFPCRDAVDRRLKTARTLPVAQSEHFYLLLSEELCQAVDSLPPLAVDVAVDWSRAILRDLLRRENEVFPERNRITVRCEEVLSYASTENALASARRETLPPQLLTNGEPHHWESDFLEEPDAGEQYAESPKSRHLYDRFAVERAAELVAYYRNRGEIPPERLFDAPGSAELMESPDLPRFPDRPGAFSAEMLAAILSPSTMAEKTASHYESKVYGDENPGVGHGVQGEMQEVIANGFGEDDGTPPDRPQMFLGGKIDISRSYIDRAATLTLDHTTPWPEHLPKEREELLQRNVRRTDDHAADDDTGAQTDERNILEGTENGPIRLPEGYQPPPQVRLQPVEKTSLGKTPLEGYPFLPTTDLMRLLHHPEKRFVQAAITVLTERDGFTESHLRIANRLYHPEPAVRKQLPHILARIPALRPADWLRELLDDPDPSVRLETVTVFGSSDNTEIRRLIREQGRLDTDARVVESVRRLESLHQSMEKQR